MSVRRSSAIALAVLVALLCAPAAHADTITIDFETGPPVGTAINDDYLASAFTRFALADPGFRPYRKTVAPALAHSGADPRCDRLREVADHRADRPGVRRALYSSLLTDWPKGTAPTLPGVVDAAIGIFGSAGGAAVTGPQPKGAEILPVLDRGAIPGAAGVVIADRGTKTISHVMEGRKDGTYDQMIKWAAASSDPSRASAPRRA